MISSARILNVMAEDALTLLRKRVAALEAENLSLKSENERLKKSHTVNADEKAESLEGRVQVFKKLFDDVVKKHQEVIWDFDIKRQRFDNDNSVIYRVITRKLFPHKDSYGCLSSRERDIVDHIVKDERVLDDYHVKFTDKFYRKESSSGEWIMEPVKGEKFCDLEREVSKALLQLGKDNQHLFREIERLTPLLSSYNVELEKSHQLITDFYAYTNKQLNKFIAGHSQYFPAWMVSATAAAPLASAVPPAPDAKAETMLRR